MDHRQFVAALPGDLKARLTLRSNGRGLVHLVLYSLCILLAALPIFLGWPFGLFAMLPLGILLVFLFTLLHETSHDTVFGALWLNRIVGYFCGLILFIPPLWFRYFHLAHHRHTHDPEKDPELAHPKPESLSAYLWHLSGLPIWWAQISRLVSNAVHGDDAGYIPPKKNQTITLEARLMLAAYGLIGLTSVAAGWHFVLVFWLVPILLGQPFLRAYLLAEHGQCPHVANMFENTRTVFTSRLIRFIAWNMPFHAEHHAYPQVPFYQLPELHNLVADQLKVTSESYRGFHREYRSGFE